MMALHLSARNMVVIVITAVACASVASSVIEDDEKFLETGVNVDEKTSQKLDDKTDSESVRNVTTTTSRHDKKMIHRLIGGHVKLYSAKVTEAKDQRETPPTRWDDDGLMMSSAGNGKEKTSSSTRRSEDDEEKKSLSQQVKEGKYGLIQNEIYKTPPKRPGIISYLGNPEVPKDTAKNLGGLEEEEIWLAENHLLVLRGGNFPVSNGNAKRPESNTGNWPPIDDYKAPERQVKIPPRPKVPPPFPVQLTEGGPVQIIRANGSVSVVNDTADYEEYANYPEGFYPGEAPFYPTSSNASEPVGTGFYGNASEGVLGPFYQSLPAGAVFVPPPSNQTDYDEEDQSIYYPPPYSFYYPQDNATAVPPGPLVPGIILPPPPNFFAELDERKPTTKGRFSAKQTTTTTTPRTTTTERVQDTTSYTPPAPTPRRKTVPKPYKARFPTTTPSYSTGTKPTTRVQSYQGTPKTIGKVKSRNFTRVPITSVTSVTSGPVDTPRYVETTTTPPEKPSTTPSGDYYDVQTDVENHLVDLGPPQGGQWSSIVSSTAVPLLAYYATTPLPSERTRSTEEDIAPVHVKAEIDIPTKNPAAYYFYEETNGPAVATTTPSPYYDVQPTPRRRQPKKQYYSVEMVPSQQTSNDFADLKLNPVIKTGQGYNEFTDPEPVARNPAPTAKYNVERIRGSVSDRENSPRYYQPLSLGDPTATVKPYYTTQRPRFYYQSTRNEQYADYRDDQEVKSSPVYQYSYEASDYTKQRQQQSYRQQEIDEVPTPVVRPVYNEYQQPTRTAAGQYYSDYDVQPVEKVQKSSGISYLTNHRQSYSAVTARPSINTTPNPHHAYYTKQDEQLLDDVTKQYFTIFGKKLPENVLQSTTPLYRVEAAAETTTESPVGHGVNTYVANNRYNGNSNNAAVHQLQSFTPPKVSVHYGDQTQRPYSLEGDTLVNYKNPLPPINPDAEFISVNKPVVPIRQRPHEFIRTEQIPTPFGNRNGGNYFQGSNNRDTSSYRGRYPTPSPISLANDISVNYRDPRPPMNPDAELIDPVQGQRNQATGGGSYFAYRLPGNGGHFYFLTPQAISQRQDLTNGGYFYSKPTATRLVRRRRRGPAEG
ncbi:extensin-2 isoform X2 [Diprion similis]|uniref:extensin-2 isoform X2 n=1 Tax=Diprion similis TaxID=362088 RepID=UPI001EF929E6|nr:extensin-2 isoform X2 [Diprion similis]